MKNLNKRGKVTRCLTGHFKNWIIGFQPTHKTFIITLSDDSQCGLQMYSTTSKHRALLSCIKAVVTSRTRPARLGLPLIEEVAELSELMEEALGLLFRVDLLFEVLALVGVVQGKPIRVTLWTGANRPYLGMHWKYLRAKKSFVLGYSMTHEACKYRPHYLSRLFTWSLLQHHRSCQVVHLVPPHTTLPWQSRSPPENEQRPPSYHQPPHKKGRMTINWIFDKTIGTNMRSDELSKMVKYAVTTSCIWLNTCMTKQKVTAQNFTVHYSCVDLKPTVVCLTSTRSPSLSSLFIFFCDSVSERFDTDSLDIRWNAALVLMPMPWAEQMKHFRFWNPLLWINFTESPCFLYFQGYQLR